MIGLLLLLLLAQRAAASSSPIRLYGLTTSSSRVTRFPAVFNRAVSTTFCLNQPTYRTLGCGAAFALTAFPGEGRDYTQPVNWQTGQPFSATAVIQGPTGISISANWSSLWQSNLTLSHSLTAAGVTTDLYWTGLYANGSTKTSSGNCQGWTSSLVVAQGTFGNPAFTDARWIDDGVGFCSSNYGLICACIPPAQVPPTPNPTGIYMFSSNQLMAPSQIGVRTQSSALCRASNVYQYLRCGNAFGLLGYQSDGLGSYTSPINPETRVPFSGTTPILGPTGVEIAKNWTSLWRADSVPLEDTTFAAGVFTSYQAYDYSGINRTGGIAPNTCDDWQIDYAPWHAEVGGDAYLDGGWVDYISVDCSRVIPYACICLPQAPTSSPVSSSPTSSGSGSASPTTGSPTMLAVDPQAIRAVGSVAFVAAFLVGMVILVV